MLAVQWKEVFRSWADKIAKTDAELRKKHLFLKVVFDDLGPEIKIRKGKGIQFEICPSCGFTSQEQKPEIGSIYEAECLVCGLTQRCLQIACPECHSNVVFAGEGFATCDCGKSLNPEDVANILLDDDAAHMAAKEGDDSYNLVDCGDCGDSNTVVRVEDEYICAACFAEFESLHQCPGCGEPTTNDVDNSHWASCSNCGRGMGRYPDE